MAICNIFRKLSKDTGNFLMFSQYSDDLTRSFVQGDAYNIVPSKFIVFDIDYSNFKTKYKQSSINDYNIIIPTYIQNYYENGCAYLKSHDLIGNVGIGQQSWKTSDFTPKTSANLFWNAMFESGLLNIKQYDMRWGTKPSSVNDAYNVIDEMRYVGDIDIHSYNEKDGTGYGELYCYIPNHACEKLYQISTLTSQSSQYSFHNESSYIEGYDEESASIDGMLNATVPTTGIDYSYNTKYIFNGCPNDKETNEPELDERNAYEYRSLYPNTSPKKSFTFNTVVVLYDIYTKNMIDGSWSVMYKDIPMGMYITGLINDDGSVNNYATKYDEVLDAYNSGTSYGLRICTRFMTTPNMTTFKSVTVDPTDQYSGFALAMNKMSESQAKMDKLIQQIIHDSQDIKNHLASFKNNKTNIPYIRTVGDDKYWFVNGRNTGVLASTSNTALITRINELESRIALLESKI